GIPPTPWDSHFPITPAAEERLTETGISRATKSGCFNLLQTWTVRDTRLRGANRTPEFRETPLFHPLAGGRTPITILLQALNLHHFFFFGLAHVFHLLDFVVRQALNFIHGAFFVIFRNLLIFYSFLVGVIAITSNVAYVGLVFFKN